MRMQHASVTLNKSFECMPNYTKQKHKNRKKNIHKIKKLQRK